MEPIKTQESPSPTILYGIEFTDRPRDLCPCCDQQAATVCTLWRANHGTSFRLCGKCAQELGVQLIRRT